MDGSTDGVERGRGRPRDTGKDDAIRDAFWIELSKRGYDGLTFERVAESAGCSRATLYRRFSTKLELVAAMLHETSRSIEPVLAPDVAPRAAFLAHAGGMALYMAGERGPAILSLTETVARVPALRQVTEAYMMHEREFYYAAFRAIAPDAIEQRMAFAFDTFVGAMLHHAIVCRTDLTPDRIAMIVDSVIFLLKS